MLVALAFLALIFDAGLAYASRRQQQNAADNAAMAGTRVIALGATDGSEVLNEVNKYVNLNNGTVEAVQYIDSGRNPRDPVTAGPIPPWAVGVQVTTRSATHTGFFSQFLDQPEFSTRAVAAAQAGPAQLNAMGGLLPFAIPKGAYEEGEEIRFWDPQYRDIWQEYPVPGLPGNSSFKGLLDLSSVGASKCSGSLTQSITCWIRDGADAEVEDGDWITVNNGDLGNNVAEPLRERIIAQNLFDAGGQYGYIDVIVYDEFQDASPSGSVHVSGFARFKVYLDAVEASSGKGEFVSFIVPGAPPGPGGVAWDPKTVRLVPLEPGPTLTPTPTITSIPGGEGGTPTPTATPDPAFPTPTATSTPACPDLDFDSGPEAYNETGSTVWIRWTTSHAASGTIEWSGTDKHGNPVSGTTGVGTSASPNINTGLDKQGSYHFTISLTDTCGQTLPGSASWGGAPLPPTATATSTATATPTNTPAAGPTSTPTNTPVPTETPTCSVTISGVSFAPTGNSGKVTVKWTTDVAADSKVEWGLTPSYGSSVSSGNRVTNHSLEISGINANTTYYWRVTSTSACGATDTETGTYKR